MKKCKHHNRRVVSNETYLGWWQGFIGDRLYIVDIYYHDGIVPNLYLVYDYHGNSMSYKDLGSRYQNDGYCVYGLQLAAEQNLSMHNDCSNLGYNT